MGYIMLWTYCGILGTLPHILRKTIYPWMPVGALPSYFPIMLIESGEVCWLAGRWFSFCYGMQWTAWGSVFGAVCDFFVSEGNISENRRTDLCQVHEFEGQGQFRRPACSLCLEKHLCSSFFLFLLPSVLWHCWLGVRRASNLYKIEWWGTGVSSYFLMMFIESGEHCTVLH